MVGIFRTWVLFSHVIRDASIKTSDYLGTSVFSMAFQNKKVLKILFTLSSKKLINIIPSIVNKCFMNKSSQLFATKIIWYIQVVVKTSIDIKKNALKFSFELSFKLQRKEFSLYHDLSLIPEEHWLEDL